MYVLPSTSLTVAPSPSRMNTGVPPTALNARTGELTPPGMRWRARSKAACELGRAGASSGMMGEPSVRGMVEVGRSHGNERLVARLAGPMHRVQELAF